MFQPGSSVRAVLALCLLLPAAGVQALPMGSQDTWMVMADASADASELAANFAFTRRDALGFALGRWEEKPHAGAPAAHMQRREFAALSYTRQLQRWNLPHAQANLWFVGGVGSARAQGHPGSHALWSAAGLADYETTRVYAGAGWELMRAGPLRHDTASARAGFSFYEAEYDEMQPWFILEVKRERFSAVAKNTVTPLLRIIHRRVFAELGANRDGAVFNLMLNY
ncbi:MAG: hypothetical protein JNJ71_13255 [Rubrivivax sp.]|nr:hypothetical protein [Rubrivivax sp.]